MRILFVIFLLLSQTNLYAAETKAPDTESKDQEEKHWKLEAQLGLISTSGNSDTRTIDAKLAVIYKKDDWTHQFRSETLRSQDSGVETANRDMAMYRARYQLYDYNYLFGLLRYESDVFAGYDQRTTEVAGYGHQLYNLEVFKWDIEAGLGANQTDNTDGTTVDEGIYRLATDLIWNFTKTSSLGQEIFVESGKSNTSTEATTALKVKINSTLAFKLTYKIKNNSDVPPGIEHTDTQTSVTLVYDFET